MMRPVVASRQVTSLLMVDPNVLTRSYVATLGAPWSRGPALRCAEFQGLNPRTAQPNMNRPLAAIQLPATRTENRDYAKSHEPAWEAQGRNIGFGDENVAAASVSVSLPDLASLSWATTTKSKRCLEAVNIAEPQPARREIRISRSEIVYVAQFDEDFCGVAGHALRIYPRSIPNELTVLPKNSLSGCSRRVRDEAHEGR